MKKGLIVLLLITGAGWLLYSQSTPLAQSRQRGQEVFTTTCKVCHQENGQGLPKLYPPLAQSDFLATDPKRAIGIVLNGLNGEITVNGNLYNMEMPAQKLNDQQVADVLNFVRNSWGNKGKAITAAQVRAQRNQ